MFKFQIKVDIIDETTGATTTLPLPAIESGETLGKVLTTAENLIKPFLPAPATPGN